MDCLEGMKQLEDNSVDLVVTDPPYGINICSGGKVGGDKPFGNKKVTIGGDNIAKAKDYGIQEWDKSIPSKEIFDQMLRVSKNQIIFGGNYFIEYLYNSSCWLVWDKDNTGNFADCELAWTSFKTAVRKYKHRWNGMLQEDMKWKETRHHPTQKPVKLFRDIIRDYSKENDLILDPFIGSGTTAIACKQLNRRFIGFEISKEYCEVANERLQQSNLKKFVE
jgi:site-specific DNA-methyltransferase (adenine-specific)